MSTVTVYKFKTRNPATEEMLESGRWATAAGIAAIEGALIEGQQAEVDAMWLDHRGLTVEGVYEKTESFPDVVRSNMRSLVQRFVLLGT